MSGMVGSGKTTVGRELVGLLTARGQDAVSLRFQGLPCFALLRSSLKPKERKQGGQPTVDKRWAGYQQKRLTVLAALVHVARIVAFRLYRLTWRSSRWHVLNRYFYDSFAHYRLSTPSERFLFAAVAALIPRPDVAIMVTAGLDTISERRPSYSSEYLAAVSAAYGRLPLQFHHLIEIRTEPGEPSAERLAALVAGRVSSGSR